MSLIVVTGPRGGAGVTSTALALTLALRERGHRPVLIEADPDGGVLAHRFALPHLNRNLATFGSDSRNRYSPSQLEANSVEIIGAETVPGAINPAIAAQGIRLATPTLVNHVAPDRPVICDIGRLRANAPTADLVAAADLAVLVLSPKTENVQAAMFQLGVVRQLGTEAKFVTVGDTPNNPAEVASVLDTELLGVIPFDAHAASAFAGARFKTRSLMRTSVWRSMRAIATNLEPLIATSEPLPPESDDASSGLNDDDRDDSVGDEIDTPDAEPDVAVAGDAEAEEHVEDDNDDFKVWVWDGETT